jgi:hypothetical protein
MFLREVSIARGYFNGLVTENIPHRGKVDPSRHNMRSGSMSATEKVAAGLSESWLQSVRHWASESQWLNAAVVLANDRVLKRLDAVENDDLFKVGLGLSEDLFDWAAPNGSNRWVLPP